MSRAWSGFIMGRAECSITRTYRPFLSKEFVRMKRQVTTAILTLCALVALVAIAASPATLFAQGTAAGKPKAVAVEPVVDVGTIAKGDNVTHDFVIKNEGAATLEITQVRPACGCTVVSFDKTIAPGKS